MIGSGHPGVLAFFCRVALLSLISFGILPLFPGSAKADTIPSTGVRASGSCDPTIQNCGQDSNYSYAFVKASPGQIGPLPTNELSPLDLTNRSGTSTGIGGGTGLVTAPSGGWSSPGGDQNCCFIQGGSDVFIYQADNFTTTASEITIQTGDIAAAGDVWMGINGVGDFLDGTGPGGEELTSALSPILNSQGGQLSFGGLTPGAPDTVDFVFSGCTNESQPTCADEGLNISALLVDPVTFTTAAPGVTIADVTMGEAMSDFDSANGGTLPTLGAPEISREK